MDHIFFLPFCSYLLMVTLILLPRASKGAALCPEKCDCDVKAKIYDCTNSDLEGIPVFFHPEMKILKAGNSKISKLEDHVNIYNQLEVLDLSGNTFRHLGHGRFSQCEKLQQLNVSNNFVAGMDAKTFEGPKAMQTLDLSRNTLTSLVNATFSPLKTLVELRLSHNKINVIQTSAFEGLSRLRVLYLDHNLMAEINPSWFEPLENLRFLYLSNNLLRTLPAFAFRPLKALQILDLAQNNLHNISDEAFYATRSLDTLKLSENLLNQVPHSALSSLKNLLHLDLSQNPVKALTQTSFSTLFVLRTLALDRMYQLTSVDLHTFVDNMQLRHLSLSNNGLLRPLPWGIFSANSALTEVNFANNTAWTSLSPNQLPIRSLKKLHLSGIPFYCNCSMTWLWELYQQNHSDQFELDRAVCDSLSNAMGSRVPLQTAKVDDLACADWTFVLLVASISILVTVAILILVSFIAYKCKQRYYASSSPCLHIKDDTMIYTRTTASTAAAAAAANFHQNPLDNESTTYAKAIIAGGYSPPMCEPFYEEPHFNHQQQQIHTKNNSSSSSKYSSSGYVGSELWENDFLGMNSQIHLNYVTSRSPRSSSGIGSNSATSSSTASSSNGAANGSKPVFFSPARNFNGYQHYTLSASNSPAKQLHPFFTNKYTSSNNASTSIRSPKGQQRSNVYV